MSSSTTNTDTTPRVLQKHSSAPLFLYHADLVTNPLIYLLNHSFIRSIDFIVKCTWSDDGVLNMGDVSSIV